MKVKLRAIIEVTVEVDAEPYNYVDEALCEIPDAKKHLREIIQERVEGAYIYNTTFKKPSVVFQRAKKKKKK